jgi:glycosyltransferase involved in cell wall biosynthesis
VIAPGCGELMFPTETPPTLESLAQDLEGKVVISYVGNMGSMHDGATLAEAILRVLASSGSSSAVVISARGDRAADLISPLTRVPGVTLLEHLDADEWAWVTHRTDIALVSLDARAALVSLPSKVFSGLAGSSAILAVAPEESDLADLVRRFDVGVVTPPGDAQAAALALLRLIDDAGARSSFARAAHDASKGFTPIALATRWANLLAPIR